MSDAPERIWAKPGMPGYTADGPVAGIYDVEYRRADLPTPNPMDDPRVKALVDAGDVMADALFGDYVVPGSASVWRAALAAMEPE